MKSNIMKLWVRALRSGKYKQGKKRLKTLNGVPKFCCLGVLCDLHSKATGNNWKDLVEDKEGEYLGMTGMLPGEVIKWAGLTSEDPLLDEDGHEEASLLNDSGKRFTTIAKLIEKAQKNKRI